MEIPRDERGLVHRAAVPLLQLQRGSDRALRRAGQDTHLRAGLGRRLRVPEEVRPPWSGRQSRGRSHRTLESEAGRPGPQRPRPASVAPRADHPRDRRAPNRARSHCRLRGELRWHELHQDLRPRQTQIWIAEVQHRRRPHLSRRDGHGWLRRRRRQGAEVADRQGWNPGRTADQSRNGAPHQRELQPRLHVCEPLAQLPVPADAEHPARGQGRPAHRTSTR